MDALIKDIALCMSSDRLTCFFVRVFEYCISEVDILEFSC